MNSREHEDSLPFTRQEIDAYASGELQDESLACRIEACEESMKLVHKIQEDNEFLTKLAGAWSTAPGAVQSGPPRQHIEGYRIINEIYRGGQGIVYRAIQENTKRIVAVKVMLGGALATERQRQRFEREVELIASLRHENIVTVYDSGVLSDGGHFLAMEFIKGVPLARAHLVGREIQAGSNADAFAIRVQQFNRICDAIQYAHQRGIIHRDLKPGNILVDRTGSPKVFDFGVAKVMGPTSEQEATLTGEFVGTFAYASPEQVKGDADAVDTRSDVYALGLILYELLTDQHPYPIRGSVSDVIKNITSTEPEPPTKYDDRISKELQAIMLKSLEKNPDDRYQSASALAQDLRSYLLGEPVEAMRDSASYLLRKVARKYRFQILVASIVVCALAIVSVFMSVLWYRATKAEHIAAERLVKVEQEARMRGEVTEMFTNIIESLQPEQGLGSELTVREMIDQAARIAGAESGNEPEVEAALFEAIGNTYLALGNIDDARQHLEKALAMRTGALGDDSTAVGDSYYSLGYLQLVKLDLDNAKESFEKSLEIRQSLPSSSGAEQANSLHALGLVHERMGEQEVALAYFQESLALRELDEEQDQQAITQSQVSMARIYRKKGEFVEADRLYRDSLARLRPGGDEASPQIATILNNLAVVERYNSHFKEAESLYRESLKQRRRFYPPRHLEVGRTLLNLGNSLRLQGNHLEAEPYMREALEITIEQLGSEHLDVANASNSYGMVLTSLGQHGAAADAFRRTLKICRLKLGNEDWRTADTGISLAIAYVELGRHEEARTLLDNGYRVLVDRRGVSAPQTIKAMLGLVSLHESLENEEEAQLWRDRIEMATSSDAEGEEH